MPKISEPHTIMSVRLDMATQRLKLRLQRRLKVKGPELVRLALKALEAEVQERPA